MKDGAAAGDPPVMERLRQWKQLHFSQLEKVLPARGPGASVSGTWGSHACWVYGSAT